MKVLSLFSGIGSFEKALTNLGINYKISGFSEIDRWAIESYVNIHGVSPELNLGNIKEVQERDMPEADLITFGFPCKDITNNGFEKGIKEGTQSGLLFEAERAINYLKPKYAIAENVRNLVGRTHREDFEKLLNRLDGYGYNNYWEILNSRDFGVPQRRERVFIVSIRKDIDDGTFRFPNGRKGNVSLEELLEGEVDPKYYMKPTQLGELVSPDGPNVRVKEATVLGYDTAGVGDSINISYPKSTTRRGRVGKGVAQTLETAPTQATLEVDGRIRKFTPLEHWRLMGYDDEDYWTARRSLEEKFYNGGDRSNTQMYKQAGNAIVVNVLEEIFKKMFKVGE